MISAVADASDPAAATRYLQARFAGIAPRESLARWNARSVSLGVLVLLGVAYAASTNRRAIQWRTIGVALADPARDRAAGAAHAAGARGFFALVNDAADAFIGAADAASTSCSARWPESVLGTDGQPLRLPYVFAIRVLPIIVFMSSVFAVLQHFGILQRVVEVAGARTAPHACARAAPSRSPRSPRSSSA